MKLIVMAIGLMITATTFAQNLKIKSDNVKIAFLADMQKTEGTIGGFDADISFNASDLSSSSISGKVDVKTLDTGNKKRNEHLKSDSFFDVENNPEITFKSKTIEKTEDGFKMTGTVNMNGVSQDETIMFSFKDNMFTAKMSVSAAEYKIGMYAKKKPEKTMVHITMSIPIE